MIKKVQELNLKKKKQKIEKQGEVSKKIIKKQPK